MEFSLMLCHTRAEWGASSRRQTTTGLPIRHRAGTIPALPFTKGDRLAAAPAPAGGIGRPVGPRVLDAPDRGARGGVGRPPPREADLVPCGVRAAARPSPAARPRLLGARAPRRDPRGEPLARALR